MVISAAGACRDARGKGRHRRSVLPCALFCGERNDDPVSRLLKPPTC